MRTPEYKIEECCFSCTREECINCQGGEKGFTSGKTKDINLYMRIYRQTHKSREYMREYMKKYRKRKEGKNEN